MKITFHGAAHEVTGSCHLLDTGSHRLLLDCGMFQGSNYNEGKNHDAFEFDPKTIDAVLVSHAHADHTGRIPKLVRDGFAGPIYMTKATSELSRIIWDDSLRIMQYNNRKFQSPVLFSEGDIARAAAACVGVSYRQEIDFGGGVSAVFKDAGHIFGAAFIEVTAEKKTVAYSGDIGNQNVPILRETDQLGHIDVLICESTYGDRVHEAEKTRREILLKIIKDGCQRGGTIMMPAFSLERTQEILYDLDQLAEHDKTLPDMPIFVDSPMAIRAIPVYKKYPEYYDREAYQQYLGGDDFLDFPRLKLTLSKEESIRINSVPTPKMIIAGAGMMNGGRILHHAKRYLPDPKSSLIIVGYQARGTLGRKLYEGAETVNIHGDKIPVRAHVRAIGALSAHGDQKKLMSWIRNAQGRPQKVYFVHGEPHASTELAHRVRDALSIQTYVPERDEVFEI
jgi:metallo-beta-lactamase family protein